MFGTGQKLKMEKSYVLSVIKSRRTVRRYKDKKVPDSKLKLILEAGQWSQSVHNIQPWKFVVIKDKNKIKKIGDILFKFASNALMGFNIVLKETAQNIKDAPVLIAVYNTHDFSKKIRRLGEPYTTLMELFEIQSVAASIQNMCLVAYDIGLGTAWLGGPLFCEKEINGILKQNKGLMAMISVGFFDAGIVKQTHRKDHDSIVKMV